MDSITGINWDFRKDGVYLNVSSAAMANIDFEQIKNELEEEHVINYDWERIEEVLRTGSGRPEFVGAPFIRFDPLKAKYYWIKKG